MAASRPWNMVQLMPDRVYDKLATYEQTPPEGLAASSMGRYLERIRRVRRQFGGAPLLKILCQGSDAIDKLKGNAYQYNLAPNTLVSDVGAILAAVKHGVSDRTQQHIGDYVKLWQSAHRLLQDQAQAP